MWTINLQKFKEISWNILKKFRQLLKKCCINFLQAKCGKIFIKIYPPFLGKLWEKIWDNGKGKLQNFDKIVRKI